MKWNGFWRGSRMDKCPFLFQYSFGMHTSDYYLLFSPLPFSSLASRAVGRRAERCCFLFFIMSGSKEDVGAAPRPFRRHGVPGFLPGEGPVVRS